MSETDELPYILIALIIILSGFVAYIIWRRCEIKRPRNIGRQSISNFKKGNPQGINSNIPLNEQAHLLPYNIKFEFPANKIEIGECFMFGTFGMVVKGIAQGILPYEEKTTVAMKTITPMTDCEVVCALVLELKILVHVRKHLNLVNLLGAITKNIKKLGITTILEYCTFGNIKDVLKRQRRQFINQIVRNKDMIDPTITTERGRRNDNYIRASDFEQQIPNNLQDRTITTTDLLCWSFQITLGMQHLASHKVLHGNLCAENIMLCDDNVIKICNFGLTQTKHATFSNVTRISSQFKWMALETIKDQVYSIYSDVWSFGIVLWELFSLAEMPYPDLNSEQALCVKLNDGYRMKQPQYATTDVYEIMYSCWHVHPKSRPLFDALEKSISKLLSDDVIQHYTALNEFFLKANAINGETNPLDFLSGISALANTDYSTQNYFEVNEVEMTEINRLPTTLPDSFNNLIYDSIVEPKTASTN